MELDTSSTTKSILIHIQPSDGLLAIYLVDKTHLQDHNTPRYQYCRILQEEEKMRRFGLCEVMEMRNERQDVKAGHSSVAVVTRPVLNT